MAEDQVIEELVSELSKEAAIVDRKENRVKYKIKKSKEFKYGDDVFKIKYVRTYYDFRWVSVNKKLFWFFYLPATIEGDPEAVKGFMRKISDVVEEMDKDSIA